MKNFLRKWLGVNGVTTEEHYILQQQVLQLSNQLGEMGKCSIDLVDHVSKLSKEINRLTLRNTLIEMVLKYGCFECFSLNGEWHGDKCSKRTKLVNRRAEQLSNPYNS